MQIRQFTSGENLAWELEAADNPASSGWAITYHFRGASTLDVNGTANGDKFSFAITPTQSATFLAGRYFYQAFAIRGTTEKRLVDEGQLEVKQNLSSASAGFDGRTPNEKTLEMISSALQGLGGDGVQSYVISTPHGSREIRNYSLAELLDLYKYFSGLVAHERRVKDGKSALSHSYFKFGRA